MKMGMSLTPQQKAEVKQEISHHQQLHHYGPLGVYLGRWGHLVVVRIEELEKEVAKLKESSGD